MRSGKRQEVSRGRTPAYNRCLGSGEGRPAKDGSSVRNVFATLAARRTLRVAGLMSGTSADGVDVAIADIARSTANLLAFDTFPYSDAVRRAVLDLCDPRASRVEELCRMNFVLGEVFAEAVIALARRNRIGPGEHRPDRFAWPDRFPCPGRLAGRTGTRCEPRSRSPSPASSPSGRASRRWPTSARATSPPADRARRSCRSPITSCSATAAATAPSRTSAASPT